MQISVEVSETEKKSRRKIERTAKIIRDNTIDNPNEVFNDNNDKAAMNIDNHDEPGDPSLDTLDGMDSFLSKQELADRKKALKKERKLSKQKSSEDSSRYFFYVAKHL